jgi:sugar lactone lactonase YvrE
MVHLRAHARFVAPAALASALLAGCAAPGSSVAGLGPQPTAQSSFERAFEAAPPKALYVSDNIGKSVFRFVLNTNGTLRAPAGSSLVLGYNPGSIAIGPKGNLFVVSLVNNSVQVYKKGACCNAKAVRTVILGFGPTGIAVDANGYLYVGGSTTSYVAVFAPGARGRAKPVQVISLPDRHFTVNGVAVDAGGNLYMSDTNEISVFSTPATNPTLARAIIGNGQQAAPTGMAFDASDELYAANPGAQNILAYSPTANGTDGADRVISANPALLANITDAVNGSTLYVNSTNPASIVLLNAQTAGTQTPIQTVTGSYMPAPVGIALGP